MLKTPKKAVATIRKDIKTMFKRFISKNKNEIALALCFTLAFVAGCYVADIRGKQFDEAVQSGIIEQYTAKVQAQAATEAYTPVAKVAPVQAVAEQPKQAYNEITVIATAYCPCAQCCGKTDGITATGTKATAGRTIAADPRFLPYGTKLIIGENTYIVEDCGGAIKGNRIDIYFDNHADALKFGRRVLTAKVAA